MRVSLPKTSTPEASSSRRSPSGTRLRVGETELEVTQIGKQCHNDCEIKRTTGKCVMPTEGIFAIVIKEGRIQAGDEIEVLKK